MNTSPCPKCLQPNSAEAVECAFCGVIFAKLHTEPHQHRPAVPQPLAALTPPDVDVRGKLISAGVAAVVLLIIGFLWSWIGAPTFEVVGKPVGEGRPTLVLLHGYGAPGTDLVPFAHRLVAAMPELTVVVPEAEHPAGRGRAWVRGPSMEDAKRTRIDSQEMLLELIDDLGVDLSEIYIGGFSQGGQMALDLVLTPEEAPELAGVAVLSGKLPMDVSAGSGHFDRLTPRTRFFVAHGSRDGTIKPSEAELLLTLLEGAGRDVTSIVFNGGHTIHIEAQTALIEFLGNHD